MSVARLHVCHCAVIKDFIYSASTGCYYFYFLYEELRTGMQANGGEKWRQFQLIISPSDILMHYYNYSRMSSKDHHTSFFRLHFSPSKNLTSNLFEKFGSLKGQYLFISLTLWKQGYYTHCHIRCAMLQGPLFISLYLHWFELFPVWVSVLFLPQWPSLILHFQKLTENIARKNLTARLWWGGWRRSAGLVFLSDKVTFIFFPFYSIWVK